jgi:acylphosphatase
LSPESTTFRIHGRVQGVGFRWWARSLALRLGVVGSVRNLPDGTVELTAGGEAAAMVRLREELLIGPPGARVDRVESSPAEGYLPSGFEITH